MCLYTNVADEVKLQKRNPSISLLYFSPSKLSRDLDEAL